MGSETDPILAGMLAKVAAWQAAVDSYRAAKSLEQGGDTPTHTGGRAAPIELPVGAFRGMTIKRSGKAISPVSPAEADRARDIRGPSLRWHGISG